MISERRTRRRSSRLDPQTNLKRDATACQTSLYNYSEHCPKKSRLSSANHSDDTVDSDISLPFQAKTWKDVKMKLQKIGWIQCDNTDCKKWRKCSREELSKISDDSKWYCWQNSDPHFNSCDCAEEDTEFYDQLARRSGLVYLKSELEPGALVWAKMPGYCRWPALVTRDPASGEVVDAEQLDDGEEEISHYHVEFLGTPHSHGWVSARHMEVFTAHSVNEGVSSTQQSGSASSAAKSRGRPGKVRDKMHASMRPWKVKTTYNRGVSVHDAVAEALKLRPMSPAKRLKHCVYIYTGLPVDSISVGFENKSKRTSQRTQQARTKAGCKASLQNSITSVGPSSESDVSQPSYTSFNSSLDNRTKEERLMLDVEMYKRNERAFEHDVTRFMLRNELKMVNGPFWQNQRISLFQLFLAVHERGGYHKVTSERGWAAVYREVSDMSCSSDFSHSTAAKNFYHKYLYPYELFIRGKDFREYIDINEKNADAQSAGKKRKGKQQVHTNVKVNAETKQDICDVLECEDEIPSESLMEMLQVMEENSKLDFEDVIDVTFYDDSTPPKDELLPLTNFEPRALRDQVVPAVNTTNNSRNNETSHKPSTVTKDQQSCSQSASNTKHTSYPHMAPPVSQDRGDIVICCTQTTAKGKQEQTAIAHSRPGIDYIDGGSDDVDKDDDDVGKDDDCVVFAHKNGADDVCKIESSDADSGFGRILLHQLQVLQQGIDFIEEQFVQ